MRFLKIALALVGLGRAVAGERLNSQPLIYTAMGCLFAALFLRFVLHRRG
jgi:hypothetical protein